MFQPNDFKQDASVWYKCIQQPFMLDYFAAIVIMWKGGTVV
jgi:hypothetical protein